MESINVLNYVCESQLVYTLSNANIVNSMLQEYPALQVLEDDIEGSYRKNGGFNLPVKLEIGARHIFIFMPYDDEDYKYIMTLKYSRWIKTDKCWEVSNFANNLDKVRNYFGNRIKSELKIDEAIFEPTPTVKKQIEHLKIPEYTIPLINKYEKWLNYKRYSPSTIKTYTNYVQRFLAFHFPRKAEELSAGDMEIFVNGYIRKNGLSYTVQNQVINATKLFFREVLESDFDVEKFERPRRDHKLPNILSREEVKKLLGGIKNIKHRMILSLIYACGLRRNELRSIKLLV